MKKVLALSLLLGVAAAAVAQQPAPAQKGSMPELSKDSVDMAKLQKSLSTKRRELVAAAIGGLSADQMQTFWGIYGDFEKERDAVMASRLSLLKNYTDNFASLSDADIVKLVDESAQIQKQTLYVRMNYFGIINYMVGVKAAGRFAHVDDYLSTIFRLAMLDNMPALQVGN
jgi:hypothetical protein